ncbi:hypothetical protein, partial [Kingella kingae]
KSWTKLCVADAIWVKPEDISPNG